MIELNNITKIYKMGKTEVVALNGVSLCIKQGEMVSIIGPSGSGKSTLMNIIGCLDKPTSGEYRLEGVEVSKLSDNKLAEIRNKRLGFVFQSFNLIDELTVYENVELPLLYLGTSGSDRKKMVEEILERMQIMARRNHFPQQLSGGQQQRVAVARAIITKPKVILADEPTGNLDSKHGDEVMELLRQLNEEGTTIVMVTHSPAYAEHAQRVIHLFDGHIVTENIKEKFHV